jgi:hypothetical protein
MHLKIGNWQSEIGNRRHFLTLFPRAPYSGRSLFEANERRGFRV